MIASLTWPCTCLLVGRWSGTRLRPMVITMSDVMYGLHRDILYHHLVELVLFSAARNSELCLKLNYWTLCFQICVELCLSNSNLVCNIIYVETLLHKNWNVVISGPAFVWAMFALPILEAKWFLLGFYPRDCRYEPSEVRVKPHLPLRWWLAHLSRFCRAVLPQLQSFKTRIKEQNQS